MNIYTPPVSEWGNPLRYSPLEKSMASRFLVPPVGYSTPLLERQPVLRGIDFAVVLPDGFVDLRTIPYRTPFGLETSLFEEPVPPNEKIANNMIPHVLRDLSGLPVETLASLVHVSRNAYYKWLDGKGVSDEHIVRLTELLNIFRIINDLRGPDLKEFLETAGPAGRPIDLLIAGNNEAVIGLALRPLSNYIDSDSVSNAARDISGLSGWVRPPVRLNWGTPHLSDSELEYELDRLSPGSQFSQVESFNDTDEDEEAFVAWGLVLE